MAIGAHRFVPDTADVDKLRVAVGDCQGCDLFKDATYAEAGSRVSRQIGGIEDMILGLDFLRSHRVLIAHSQRKLYFTYIGGTVFQPRSRLSPPGASGPERAVAPPAGGG